MEKSDEAWCVKLQQCLTLSACATVLWPGRPSMFLWRRLVWNLLRTSPTPDESGFRCWWSCWLMCGTRCGCGGCSLGFGLRLLRFFTMHISFIFWWRRNARSRASRKKWLIRFTWLRVRFFRLCLLGTFLTSTLLLFATGQVTLLGNRCYLFSCVLNRLAKAVAPSPTRRRNRKRNSSIASCNLVSGRYL